MLRVPVALSSASSGCHAVTLAAVSLPLAVGPASATGSGTTGSGHSAVCHCATASASSASGNATTVPATCHWHYWQLCQCHETHSLKICTLQSAIGCERGRHRKSPPPWVSRPGQLLCPRQLCKTHHSELPCHCLRRRPSPCRCGPQGRKALAFQALRALARWGTKQRASPAAQPALQRPSLR